MKLISCNRLRSMMTPEQKKLLQYQPTRLVQMSQEKRQILLKELENATERGRRITKK